MSFKTRVHYNKVNMQKYQCFDKMLDNFFFTAFFFNVCCYPLLGQGFSVTDTDFYKKKSNLFHNAWLKQFPWYSYFMCFFQWLSLKHIKVFFFCPTQKIRLYQIYYAFTTVLLFVGQFYFRLSRTCADNHNSNVYTFFLCKIIFFFKTKKLNLMTINKLI